MTNKEAWVFLSHSSADLAKVRQIRNFMEERGAGPILFYLRALTNPEQFWPLIEREIAARNFFLLCDSEAARSSAWVQREWDTVRHISQFKPIRVGRIDLGTPEVDFNGVENFLKYAHVYVVGEPADIAFRILRSFGFGIIGAVNFSAEGLEDLHFGHSQAINDMIDHLYISAAKGWLLVLMNSMMAGSATFWDSLPERSGSYRIIFITPPDLMGLMIAQDIPGEFLIAQTGPIETALEEAARRMLSSGPREW